MPDINPPLIKEAVENWQPYARDKESLVITWAVPGTKGLTPFRRFRKRQNFW